MPRFFDLEWSLFWCHCMRCLIQHDWSTNVMSISEANNILRTGVQNSINNAMHIGGNSFALFLKSQRKWSSPALADEARDQFKAFCLEHNYDAENFVLPHGSYLVNLAQKDAEKADQAYICFLDDLHRCEA